MTCINIQMTVGQFESWFWSQATERDFCGRLAQRQRVWLITRRRMVRLHHLLPISAQDDGPIRGHRASPKKLFQPERTLFVPTTRPVRKVSTVLKASFHSVVKRATLVWVVLAGNTTLNKRWRVALSLLPFKRGSKRGFCFPQSCPSMQTVSQR
jgi:hypothetical protein